MNKGPKVRKYDKLSLMTGSLLQRAYTWLEPDEGKLSCPVLRGGSVSNDALLPDSEVPLIALLDLMHLRREPEIC